MNQRRSQRRLTHHAIIHRLACRHVDAPYPGLLAHVKEHRGLHEPRPAYHYMRCPVADLQEVALVCPVTIFDQDADYVTVVCGEYGRQLHGVIVHYRGPRPERVDAAAGGHQARLVGELGENVRDVVGVVVDIVDPFEELAAWVDDAQLDRRPERVDHGKGLGVIYGLVSHHVPEDEVILGVNCVLDYEAYLLDRDCVSRFIRELP